jgi:SAM-dependent methyltransferase
MMSRHQLFAGLLSISLLASCKSDGEQTSANGTDPDTTTQEQQGSKGFEELSSDYYDIQSRVIWQKPEMVISLLGNLRGKTIADIGAGTGFFAFRLANQGAKVIAIDIDPRAIEWMEREKHRYPVDVQALLEPRLATPDNPNLGPAEADVVLMVNTYIYLDNRVTYFRELRDRLKPDARIMIIDFKDQETPIGPSLDERVGLHQVLSELSSAGYSIITSDDRALEYQYIVIATLQN